MPAKQDIGWGFAPRIGSKQASGRAMLDRRRSVSKQRGPKIAEAETGQGHESRRKHHGGFAGGNMNPNKPLQRTSR